MSKGLRDVVLQNYQQLLNFEMVGAMESSNSFQKHAEFCKLVTNVDGDKDKLSNLAGWFQFPS